MKTFPFMFLLIIYSFSEELAFMADVVRSDQKNVTLEGNVACSSFIGTARSESGNICFQSHLKNPYKITLSKNVHLQLKEGIEAESDAFEFNLHELKGFLFSNVSLKKELVQLTCNVLFFAYELHFGHYHLTSLSSEGPTFWSNEDSRFYSPNGIYVNPHTQTLLAEKSENAQLYFENALLKIYADAAKIEPTCIEMQGHIILLPQKNQIQYGIADKILFYPKEGTLILEAENQNRVLFYHAGLNAEISADAVEMQKKEIKGKGRVRLHFHLEEKKKNR